MPRSSSEPPPIRDYSQPWPEWALSKQSLTPTEHKILQLHFDRRAFADRVSIEDGAPPRPALFRQLAETLIPGLFEWHDWTDKVVDVLCRRRWSAFTGASNSAKTFNVVNFACAWWMAAPEESSVILCSTTMKMLKKRAFAEVQRFYFEMTRATGGTYGTFVPSQTLWRSALNDDKHGIFGLAVAEGNTEKVADNIKGIHTKRQMVVIDEATAVPAAIWDATTNLYGYPIDSGGEFVLVALGNARSRLDQFGRFIEPEEGWDSVSIETDEWETKPRAEDGKRVLVTRFDFRRSPNVLADKRISKHLPTKQRVESRMASLKARGAENDPTHYSNDLGFPPPEGLTKTVFTESLIQVHDGYGRHRFTGVRFRIIGAYDQARTGDRPTLRFAAIGEIEGGGMGIEWMAPIIFYPDASAKDPIAYQYLKLLRNNCARVDYRDQQYACEPKHLGIDCSNEATFGDLCQREWSNDIIRIQFGGAASEDAISHEDQRPANQVFKNKRAEMYFRTQYALTANQLKGIDKDTAAELTSIEYVDVRPDGTSKLITMMDKKEYRLKFGSSPDLSDCFVAGTMILTPTGEVPIESIVEGDEVVTPLGTTKVHRIIKDTVNVLTEVDFSNGSKLCGKGKHRVFTFDKGWVRLDRLSLINIVESDRDLWKWKLLGLLFTKETNTGFKALVDTIRHTTGLRRRDFFTESFGRSAMALFRKACASITRTAIGKITESRIWNCLKGGRTADYTCDRDSKTLNINNAPCSPSNKRGQQQQNGTEARRGSSGTGRTESMSGKTGPRMRGSARSAERCIGSTLDTRNRSAQMRAGRGQDFTRRFTSFPGSVLSAAKSFLLSSTARQGVVPVRVETVYVQERSVFNLTLEEHNAYYANGILVENCGVMILEVARLFGFRVIATGNTVDRTKEFEDQAAKAHAVYEDVSYSSDNEESDEQDLDGEVEGIYE